MSEKLTAKPESFGTGKREASPLENMPSYAEHMKDVPKLTEEQIKEIHKQDKINRRDWENGRAVSEKRQELEKLYAAEKRGDEWTVTKERHVLKDDEWGAYRNVEAVNDVTIAAKEQELAEAEKDAADLTAAQSKSPLAVAMYKLKKLFKGGNKKSV